MEDRPIRSLAAALALTLLLPATALAQEPVETDEWPTADELRRDLQAIGYEFLYDDSNRALESVFRPELPGIWRLTEPAVVELDMPEDIDFEPFGLMIAEMAGLPAQVVFSVASADGGEGEWGTASTVLMEVAARLPDESGLDAAVWYIGNMWLPPNSGEKTELPCYVQEFDGGAMVVWSGGDGEQVTSFFGTVTHFDGESPEVAQCRATQGQTTGELDSTTGEATQPIPGSADLTVTPAEAVDLIESGEHVIIDVRTPAEYESAHIVGATNIDVDGPDFADRIAELDPNGSYLLYCRTGNRSDQAAGQMTAVGIADVADAGGLADLARAGAPIE